MNRPNRPTPLTQLAHTRLAQHLRPGDWAIDATAGNGHDAEFMAGKVGMQGLVCVFDVQAEALRSTRTRLQSAGLDQQLLTRHACHAQMLEQVPENWLGRVAAITFNLGYLPGGDKRIVTQTASTLAALRQSLQLLRPGGLLSVIVYPGHPGGAEEASAVAGWLSESTSLSAQRFESPGPVLYLAETCPD